MSGTTSIEWTDCTWNPVRARVRQGGRTGTHCERISTGCTNCYASRHNGRMLPSGGTGLDYTRTSRDRVETYLDEKMLAQPLRWQRPRKIFVGSLTDIFGEWVPDEMLDRLFAVMALTPHITFQVLTKRVARMRAYLMDLSHRDLDERLVEAADTFPPFLGSRRLPSEHVIALRRGRWPFARALPNVWLGVSCEDQKTADERIPILLDTPAAVRFVSAEPLLGPINFRQCSGVGWCKCQVGDPIVHKHYGELPNACARCDCDAYVGLDWAIVGGESGPGARPCDIANIRSVVEQCNAAGVACFVKQWGSYPEAKQWSDADIKSGFAARHGNRRIRLANRKGGDLSELPEDVRVREFPRAREAVPS